MSSAIQSLVDWTIPGQTTPPAITVLDLLSGEGNHLFSFQLDIDTGFDNPGDALAFAVKRDADSGTDTCGDIFLVGAQVRY